MAESADILAQNGQISDPARPQRRLFDGRHGRDFPGRRRWDQFVNLGLTDDEGNGITPITYMNSTAAIKAFCGERGGMVCTSSNAKSAFDWALRRNEKLFFLPDQHLGRNTGFARGHPARGYGGVGSLPAPGRPQRRPPPPGEGRPVEGPLLGAPAFSARARGQSSGDVSGYAGDRASRVPLGGLPEGRRYRFNRLSDHAR